MKKIFNLVMVALSAIVLFSCDKQDDDPVIHKAPEMIWAANPDFAVTKLAQEMDINIKVKAEAGIKTFVVKVNSSTLSPVIEQLTSDSSANMNLIGDIDLINSLNTLTGGILPMGDQLENKTEVDFNLSSLVPMILEFSPAKGSDHEFTLDVTDMDGQNLSKKLTFHYSGESKVAVEKVDLWNNTAVLNASFADDVKSPALFFGKKGETLFEIKADSAGTYIVAPEYEKSVNDGGNEIFSLKEGTGVFAGNDYVAELRDGEKVIATLEYTADNGDVIPNGNMSGWSFREWKDTSNKAYKITYPNVDGEQFWDSGNNAFLEQYDEQGNATIMTPLCMQGEEGTALLSARKVLGFVFAPGNMYTGDFEYSGFTGTAKFGKKYEWTARPSALKVRFKANVGLVDNVGSYDPEKDSWSGKQDISRIYVAVIDWNAQHGVTSGMGEPSGMWDPIKEKSVDEGAIIGYASLDITESTEGFVTEDITFNWYDTKAKPAEGNYSIVISCATSSRGDYLTGCGDNTLVIDNLEWVY